MKKIFPYLYFLFILSQFMIGQIRLPFLPLNILQFTTLIILAFCILIDHKIPHDRNVVLYSCFLLCYFISCVFTGHFSSLVDRVIPQFFISFTVLWATKILIQHFNTLQPLVLPLIITGVLDSIVTILQAIGIPIFSPAILMLMQSPETMDIAADGLLGRSISGIFANPVFNGHVLLFCFVSSMFVLQHKSYRLIGFISSIIIFAGIFFCQQRSAFYLSVFVLLLVGWKLTRSDLQTKILVLLISLAIVFYFFPRLESYAIDSGSRIVDTSMTGRTEIWATATNFISDHLLIGGFDSFIHQTGKYPHNLILSAFLAGGLFGGIILMIMIITIFIKVLKSLSYSDKNNISLLVSACLIFVLICDSMTHNTGLVEADFATFLAMSLSYYYNEMNPQKIFK